jgi:hypothetical protein
MILSESSRRDAGSISLNSASRSRKDCQNPDIPAFDGLTGGRYNATGNVCVAGAGAVPGGTWKLIPGRMGEIC